MSWRTPRAARHSGRLTAAALIAAVLYGTRVEAQSPVGRLEFGVGIRRSGEV